MSDVLRRVVIDPNVFVSAAITSTGATAMIVELIDAAGLTPIVSPHLLAELTEVLLRDKFRAYLGVETASAYIAELERLAEVWQDPRDKEAVSPDPDDDYLIALARAADADALVSGDRDLKGLGLADVRVLSPRELLDAMELDGTEDQA